MVKIDDEVIRLLLKHDSLVYVGSVNENGIPNISPRFALDILAEDTLLFADVFKNKTYHNLAAWPKVTVAVVDQGTMGGFQLKGDVQEVTDRELIALAEKKLKERGLGKPVKVWTMHVNEVYSERPNEGSREPLASAYG